MKRLLLTIALLFAVAVAGAQVTTSSVRGVVTDNDNNPIAGAAVVARHEPSGSTYGVCTNADGHYAINGMRVADHTPSKSAISVTKTSNTPSQRCTSVRHSISMPS